MEASWIVYPGDYELWLHREVSLRRDERLSIVPPFWRLDTHYGNVKFYRWIDLEQEEQVNLYVEGRYNIAINDRYVYGNPSKFTVPAGKSLLAVSVVAEVVCPAIFLQGQSFVSDSEWKVTANNHRIVTAASLNFQDPMRPPSSHKLAVEPIVPTAATLLDKSSTLIDFGKETFGYVRLHGIRGQGQIGLFYGESREEALSVEACETYDLIQLDETSLGDDPKLMTYTHPSSRAFRYVQVVCEEGIQVEDVSALYEYLPVEYKGKFRCSDDRINEIWNISLYTLHLTTREFFLDGIKRDRWVWSGDACQSFLMNYYSFFDNAVCRRTLIALRGKDPVETHINHILDYSFYWILSLQDYYDYSGDTEFVRDHYPKALSLLEFCAGRENDSGFFEGQPDDWVFVDWAEMNNRGEVCFEQVLYCRSLEIVAGFAERFDDAKKASALLVKSRELREKIIQAFWDPDAGGLVHGRREGVLDEKVTKYANMFALSYGYLNETQTESVIRNVMLNDEVQRIVTPYMRFYELAALCGIGETSRVVEEIKSYWGGMLDLGATSFWETFDPSQSGSEHYAMYGRPFGKSLCHSWGASPLYLLGKYVLGVRPTEPGYAAYILEPSLGGLDWIEGSVPTPSGEIAVYADANVIKLTVPEGKGLLRFRSSIDPRSSDVAISCVGEDVYEAELVPHSNVLVHYRSF
ncbi:alpha-L-rhamnosidase-related protein [Cohnella herbarum]|uniref:Alpha-rhamnosidase n=1 Tax=Cohnella herbarum TaxID=2728023 RepID=A0A7Z2VK09_9BACL|nr:alpha-L-rhamnosidase C-terminal domain-containing protein [Cohnella herbarum]QJD84299.1 alpha-rhamnosidase [Cohnella herbarum]